MLALVVLLGFTALAIDGSVVYSDRRYAQNAADAASLAGGGEAALELENAGIRANSWSCLQLAINKGEALAIYRAGSNDFAIDDDITDDHGVDAYCGVETVGSFQRDYLDVEVSIIMDSQPAYAQIVNRNQLRNTVKAVTRVYPRHSLAWGNAIVSLNPDTSNCNPPANGMYMGGTATLTATGGGLWSNGCMNRAGTADVTVVGAGAMYFDSANNSGLDGIVFVPPGTTPTQLSNPDDILSLSLFDIDVPIECGDSNYQYTANELIDEGHNTGLNGLYCVTGNVSINNANEVISGTETTIVMLGGRFQINGPDADPGDPHNSLTAPGSDYQGPAIPGVLIYMPTEIYGPDPSDCGDVNQELKINGNAVSDFTGSIIAPCSDIQLEGSDNSNVYNSQVIGWDIQTLGTGSLNVFYDDSLNYSVPTKLGLHR